jgi:hypothetical protein
MNPDPKDYLLFALNHFGLPVLTHEGKLVTVEGGYAIEVEGENLYKLMHLGSVVGPFADVERLCEFIQMDKRLNA